MKNIRIIFLLGIIIFGSNLTIKAQNTKVGEEIHLNKLIIDKKKKHTFQGRDSILTVYIDTLVMKDKSTLHFFGKKDVNLIIKKAFIEDEVSIYGQGLKNNGSNFNIDINFNKLGSLYIIAKGQDANNGTKTFPNGDGGNVTLAYKTNKFALQTSNKKEKHYLRIENSEGGLAGSPTTDIANIYSRISTSPAGLRGLPQGQIYSGSPGRQGEIILKEKN